MLTPQNDEERKALRLLNAWPAGYPHIKNEPGFLDEKNRGRWLFMLAEARAIVREEQASPGGLSPSELLRISESEVVDLRRQLDDAKKLRPLLLTEIELVHVRADITRTAAVGEFLTLASDPAGWPDGVPAFLIVDCTEQVIRMHSLLSRERELMAKSEPEGGDRG